MPYYDLFWMRSPYLDLRWRSRSTGTIPELLIISIVRHKNKNRWVGDPLWRSCSLFCVEIFHESEYPYTEQFTWSPQGIPPFTCSCYSINALIKFDTVYAAIEVINSINMQQWSASLKYACIYVDYNVVYNVLWQTLILKFSKHRSMTAYFYITTNRD